MSTSLIGWYAKTYEHEKFMHKIWIRVLLKNSSK